MMINCIKIINIYFKILLRFVSGQRLPNWKKINLSKNPEKSIKSKNENILIAVSAGGLQSMLVFESMIGSVLKYEGYNVDYLLCDEILPACVMASIDNIDEKNFAAKGSKEICSFCFVRANRYLKSSGGNVLKFSDFITDEELRSIKDKDYSNFDFSSIRKLVNEGVNVGEHANAGAIRYYLNSDYENLDNSKNILEKYLKSAIITQRVTERILKEKKYKEVFLNHGIYVPQGVIMDCARKLKVNCSAWTTGYRRNSIIVTRNDSLHRQLIYEDNSTWEQMKFDKKNEKKIDEYLKSRWVGDTDWEFYSKNPKFNGKEYLKERNLDLSKPIVGLATNVMWDAQISFPNKVFLDMLEWLFFTIDFFTKNDHLQLVIRIHPAELNISKKSSQRVFDEVKKRYKNLPKNILLIKPDDDISTYSVFEKCNCVITYGSKIAIETAAVNIPTIVCGENFVKNKNVTIDIDSKEDYLKVLKEIPLPKNIIKDKILRAKKYAYHFWFRKMMKVESIYEDKNIYKDLSINIKDDLFKKYDQKKDPGLLEIINSIMNKSEFILKDENLEIKNSLNDSKF